MTPEREHHVFIVLPGRTEFVRAGRFRLFETRDGPPRGEFLYARPYLERPDAVELDPVELRLSGRRFRTQRLNGFFGAIRDAMPDQWGQSVLDSRHSGFRLGEFDYLELGPDDHAGALGFAAGPVPPAPRLRFCRPHELEPLRDAAHAFAASKAEASARVLARLLEPTSMGGARPKIMVQNDQALWLVKLGRPDDRWNHPRVEHGLLWLARQCGLDTADSHTARIGGNDMLFVRRFDRDQAETGWFRHRMVSALTVLHAGNCAEKRERWSYLLLADEIRRISARPRRDLRELYGRMCFNAAVSNFDDHSRNHAFLARGGSWRLSPAYDLNPMPFRGPDDRQLAMICGRSGRRASRANLLSGHGHFLLPQEEAAAIYDRVKLTAGTRWYATMRRAGVTDRDCETISSAFPDLGPVTEKAGSET